MAKLDNYDREPLLTTEGSAQDKQEAASPKLCRICGAVAINCNFGVISCESCKAFFRRNANNQALLLAAKCQQGCIITKETRTDCKRCRLQKCFREGMDKALILSEEQLFERRKRIRENKANKRKDSWRPGTDLKGSKIFTFQDAFIQSCTDSMSDQQLHQKIRNRLKVQCSNRLFGRLPKEDSPKARYLNSFDEVSEESSMCPPLVTAIEEPIQEYLEETQVARNKPMADMTQELLMDDDDQDHEENATSPDIIQDGGLHDGTYQNQSSSDSWENRVESNNTCDQNPVGETEVTVKSNQINNNDHINEICLSDASGSLVSACDSVSASQMYGSGLCGVRTTSEHRPVPLSLKNKVSCHKDVSTHSELLAVHDHSFDASGYFGSVKRSKTSSREPRIKAKQGQHGNTLKRSSEMAKNKASQRRNWQDETIWMLKEEIAKRHLNVQEEKLNAETTVEKEYSASSVSVNSHAYEMWSSTSVAASVFRETATADFQLPFTSCLATAAELLCPQYAQVLICLENGCSRALDKPILGKFFENPSLIEFFNQCEGLVPVYVSFAKCLEGFSAIPLEIQIDLVKSSFVCFLGLYCLPRFDSLRKTITMTTCADDLKGTIPVNTSPELVIDTTRYDELYDFAVRHLQCDTFIILLTMCFFLFTSNSELLEKYEEIAYWSQLYLQILIQYVSKKYPGGEVRASDIDDFLLKVKQAASRFSTIVESVDLSCVKPMVRELYEK